MLRYFEVRSNDAMSPLFLAVIEATEEAVYNSLFSRNDDNRTGTHGRGAAPEKTTEILKKYGTIK